MRSILAILSLLLTPVAVFTASPAAAQMEGSLGCGAHSNYSQRWNSRRYEYTGEGTEVQNGCDFAIRYYYCFSADPNPESCASVSQFYYVTLPPRGRQRLGVNRTRSIQYVHNIQCLADEPLIDWHSKFTDAKGPRCQSPLPADVDRRPYPLVGTAPNPNAPKATMRSPQSIAARVEFPYQLLGTMAEGRTIANIAVSPEGRAIGCQVTGSAGFYLMDKATCDIYMRYGRFVPATDAGGNPVVGVFEARITWTSP